MAAPAVPAAPGELAIVLHTHMPYAEGFGVRALAVANA